MEVKLNFTGPNIYPRHFIPIHGAWKQLAVRSTARERAEAEKKYNITIGQTDIKCNRCKKSCWPGNHTCPDIQLQKARVAKQSSAQKTPDLIAILRRFEPKMIAIMLEVPVKYINHWIERENVPKKYHDAIRKLVKPRQQHGESSVGENAP